jgi:endonuclease YncB( thermonuclease family)
MPTVLPGRRRRPLAWLSRSFGLVALGGVIGYAAALGVVGRPAASPPSTIRGGLPHTTTAPTLAGFATVIDGDTLRIGGEKVRIEGIDAPELRQTCRDAQGRDWACGRIARQRLAAFIAGNEVACTERGRDRYGRMLAVCAAGAIADLGGALVRAGYAVDYRRYSTAYAADARSARAERRGLWQGQFDNPEDWRRRGR